MGPQVIVGGDLVGPAPSAPLHIAAVDADSSRTLPESERPPGTVNALAVHGGAVYAAGSRSGGGWAARYDPQTGRLDPAFSFLTSAALEAVAASGQSIYLTGGTTDLFAVDAATGQPLAAFRPPSLPGISLAATGRAVYVGGYRIWSLRSRLAAVDARTGALLRRFAPPMRGEGSFGSTTDWPSPTARCSPSAPRDATTPVPPWPP